MQLLQILRPYALGASAAVLADRVIDVQLLTWPAVIVIIACMIVGGFAYGRGLHS